MMKAFEAIKLFDEISRDPQMHMEKPHTGCFIRARKIAEKLADMGEKASVVYAEDKRNGLEGRIAYREDRTDAGQTPTIYKTNWKFHIAAAAEVQNLDGVKEMMVFDPAVADGPLSVAGWARTLTGGGVVLGEKDVRCFSYAEAKPFIDKTMRQTGFKTDEEFFAAQQDKFAGKQIVRRSSILAKKYREMVSGALAQQTQKN